MLLTAQLAQSLVDTLGRNLEIPEIFTAIDESAFENIDIISVTIPHSVVTIGNYAFYHNSLRSVDLGEGVTNIGDYAFTFNDLTSIVIPDSVTTIGEHAFYSTNIQSADLGQGVTTIGERAFSFNGLTSIEIPDSVTTLGVAAFSYNNLTSIDLGNGVTAISSEAFYLNPDLLSIKIPDSLTILDHGAFRGTSLTNVVIPNSLTPAYNAFNDDVNILSPQAVMSIPSDITLLMGNLNENISEGSSVAVMLATDSDQNDYHNFILIHGAGDDDNNLFTIAGNSLLINESPNYEITNSYSVRLQVEDLAGNIYSKSFTLNVEDVNEPPVGIELSNTTFDVLPVKGAAILDMTAIDEDEGDLHSFTLVDGWNDNDMFEIDDTQLIVSADIVKPSYEFELEVMDSAGNTYSESFEAFFPVIDANIAYDLLSDQGTDVVIPNGIQLIAEYAFEDTYLSSIVIPDSVTTIGVSAFLDSSLVSVDIGEGVTTIGDYAFAYTDLSSVVIPDGVMAIGDNAFHGTNISTVYLPDSVINISPNAFDLDVVFVTDANNDGFSDEITNYHLFSKSGGFDLTYRGNSLSHNTSRKWDAIKAIEIEDEFSILLEGERRFDDQYRVVTADSFGTVVEAGRWLTGNQLAINGYEDIFSVDLNGNGQVGF